jgi:hypothetical protein
MYNLTDTVHKLADLFTYRIVEIVHFMGRKTLFFFREHYIEWVLGVRKHNIKSKCLRDEKVRKEQSLC